MSLHHRPVSESGWRGQSPGIPVPFLSGKPATAFSSTVYRTGSTESSSVSDWQTYHATRQLRQTGSRLWLRLWPNDRHHLYQSGIPWFLCRLSGWWMRQSIKEQLSKWWRKRKIPVRKSSSGYYRSCCWESIDSGWSKRNPMRLREQNLLCLTLQSPMTSPASWQTSTAR